MELVDINRSGEVDFTGIYLLVFILLEFLIAAMNQEKFLSV